MATVPKFTNIAFINSALYKINFIEPCLSRRSITQGNTSNEDEIYKRLEKQLCPFMMRLVKLISSGVEKVVLVISFCLSKSSVNRSSFALPHNRTISRFKKPCDFIRDYIVKPTDLKMGQLFGVNPDKSLYLNELGREKLRQDESFLRKLLENSQKSGDSSFVKIALSWLGLKPPPPGSQWLDGRYDKYAINEFQDFLSENLDKKILPNEQAYFAATLNCHYQKAFGRNKNDRPDREWQATTIKRRLADVNSGYTLSAENGVWVLRRMYPNG